MRSEDKLCLLGMMESIDKISAYTCDMHDFDQFSADQRTMDACLMHLVNIGEMTTRLTDELIIISSDIEWHKIKGLRNIIAHDYFGIDYQEIWAIVSIHIPALRNSITKLLR